MSTTAHALEDSFLLTSTTEPCLLSSSSLSSQSSLSGQLSLEDMMSTPNLARGRARPAESVDDDTEGPSGALQETSAIAELSPIRASFTRLRKKLDVQQLSSAPNAVCAMSSVKTEVDYSRTRTASLNTSKRARQEISVHGYNTTAVAAESLDGSAAYKRNRQSSSTPRPTDSALVSHSSRPLSTTHHSNKNMKFTVPRPFTFTASASSTDTASVVPDRQRYYPYPAALSTKSTSSTQESALRASRSSNRDALSTQGREKRPEKRCISPRAGRVPSFREIHLQDEARQARRTERIRSERAGEIEKEERGLGRRVEQRGRERARWENERRERERERERGREEEQKREQKHEELQISQERKATVIRANPISEMYSSTLPHASSTIARPHARTNIRTQLD
ncbi:hypothetical protein [Phaffia rhodozyma]|uniref:TPX2 C-terminal domain-containing protein n=1 Tax=Phaffia rhodozyma TaxID=264483 RepID=A0A0F7SMU0_PHARH|nr:hypothetical protein [Phaffia rhodozyma]